MLFVGLVLLGVVSVNQLPVELYPNAELPFLVIQVNSMQDLDPGYMEQEAVMPLEGAASSLRGIDKIESYVQRQQATIIVYFDKGVDIKYAYLHLDEKIREQASSLDDTFVVNVFKIDTQSMTNMFMGLQVRGTGGLDRVREIADQKIAPKLENIDGVANVDVFGGREKSIEIILNENADAYNITVYQIRNLIAQNSQYKTFVGRALKSGKERFVNLVADYTDVRQLENIIVDRDASVRLGDISEVYFGVKDPESLSRVNSKDAVTVQLSRDSQSNLIEVAHKVRDQIDLLNKQVAPLGVDIVIQSDSAEQIEENIDMIIDLALLGGLFAVFVLWVFLRNIRWVLIIALAIPISIYTAFNFFYLGDISLNSLTLVGLALAVGMLLDNSVVVMENIYRLLSRGKHRDDAVMHGTSEVWRSIVAATLTTITVFVPFVFAENFLVRILGRHIGVSIISMLAVSLVVALLFIPMTTHVLLGRRHKTVGLDFQFISTKNRLLQIYNVILKSCMRYPARTIIGAVFFFFLSVLIALAVSINVPTEVESRTFDLYVTMGSGATLDQTDQVVKEVEDRLMAVKEKEEIISKVYEEEAIITLKLQKEFEKIEGHSLSQIKEAVNERIKNVSGGEISFEQPQASQRFRGGGGQNPGAGLQRMLGIGTPSESVIIKGRDIVRMQNLAEDIQTYLENSDVIANARLNVAPDRPEVHLLFDHILMSNYGVTLPQVAQELSTFQQQYNTNLTFKQGTEEYNIIIRRQGEEEEGKKIRDLKKLSIPSESGEMIDLVDISDIVLTSGTSSLYRENQEKQIEVTYRFQSEVTDSKDLLLAARAEVDDLIASINVPTDMAIEVVHDDTDLSDFYFLIGAAFILIFMILAAVFESLSTPVVMMFTIPLAAIGSLWALILTGNSLFNANTLIGFLILLGVVVNNGIIYIDYTRILRQRGFSRSRALMTAGQTRVRPILITAITTIIAMLPLALGKAEYVEQIGAPFAITVIGGLALSTVFTLIFIPTFYTGLENAIYWIRHLRLPIKLIQIAMFIPGCVLIFSNIDSVLWRGINLFLLTILVPGITYFVLTSLRRAQTQRVRSDEPLHITIQRLVKIYEEPSRFVREWRKGLAIRERSGITKKLRSLNDFDVLIWQTPLLIFLGYFNFIYLKSGFWYLVFSLVFYFTMLNIWQPVGEFINWKLGKASINKNTHRILFWGFPLFALCYFFMKWESIGWTIVFVVLWYLGLAVFTTSNRLHREQVNLARLTGRFAGIRRQFYTFVKLIPVIGKKRVPFRALDGVSLEISSGMFGLVGPNGAGKTTLMRAICGILEQSRGKIRINGFDLSQYREEFQGLIGYLPQEFGMYENMTAFEFLDYQAMLKGMSDPQNRKQRIAYVLQAVHMQEHQDEKIESFSGGMKQRIGIAQTLLHLPRILVVDEPTAGLDPRERIRFRNLLVDLSQDRIVIFSTHIIEDISSSCHRVAVLHKGQLGYTGEPAHMAKLAEGRVWQFMVSPEEFGNVQQKYTIIHHMRTRDNQIRVRCLAEQAPAADAVKVRPTLEDSYLWLLKQK